MKLKQFFTLMALMFVVSFSMASHTVIEPSNDDLQCELQVMTYHYVTVDLSLDDVTPELSDIPDISISDQVSITTPKDVTEVPEAIRGGNYVIKQFTRYDEIISSNIDAETNKWRYRTTSSSAECSKASDAISADCCEDLGRQENQLYGNTSSGYDDPFDTECNREREDSGEVLQEFQPGTSKDICRMVCSGIRYQERQARGSDRGGSILISGFLRDDQGSDNTYPEVDGLLYHNN